MRVNSSQGDLELELCARWTWVDRSNMREEILAGQATGAYELKNIRLKMVVKWRFR